MVKIKATVISLFCLIGLLGCTATLTGGGTIRVGMSNDNFLEVSHTVDGDKEGKVAESQLEIDQTILDAVLPSPADDPDPEPE